MMGAPELGGFRVWGLLHLLMLKRRPDVVNRPSYGRSIGPLAALPFESSGLPFYLNPKP